MRTRTLLVASLLGLSASPALAFQMKTATWTAGTVTLQVNPDVALTFPDHNARIVAAANKVNGNASALRFALATDNDAVSATGNSENELALTTSSTLLCGSVGCTWTWSSGGLFTEADVYLSSSNTWSLTDARADHWSYSATGNRPLISTAMHEMLHTMGCEHENNVVNIMGQSWSTVSVNGSSTEIVVSEDSTSGLLSVYGPRATAVNDLSVLHWKFDAVATGASAYSNHERSELLDSSGTPLTLAAGYYEPTYLVNKGQVIQVEMTLENRGTSSESRSLGTYFSTNDFISTSDTLLSTTTPTLGVNTPYETTRTVTIPSTATSGTVYWIGAIIDNGGALAEANEINNASYIAAVKIN